MNIETVARLVGWVVLCVIVVLSYVPPTLRLVTVASQFTEHFAIFFLAGGCFALGYRRNAVVIGSLAVAAVGIIELLQLVVPGRHARVSDFIVNALGACG